MARPRLPEKLFQSLEHLVLRAMPPDGQHILQFFDLTDHLFEPRLLLDQQPDATLTAIADGHAKNAFDVIGAT